MKLGQRQRRLQDLQLLRTVFGDPTKVAVAGTLLASIRKQENELHAMMNPEVLNYRNQAPKSEPAESQRNVRPPPKAFTDFEANRKKEPQQSTFVPEPAPTQAAGTSQADEDHETQNVRQRLGFLEDRAEKLEDLIEDLTELVTKPKQEASLTLIRRLVQLTVIDGLMPPEACLRAIARDLGVLAETSPLTAPAPKAPAPPAPRNEVQVTHWDPHEAVAEPLPKKTGRPRKEDAPALDAERKKALAILAKHELSQNQFATDHGVHQGTLSRWLRGHNVANGNVARIRRGLAKLEK